MGDKNSIIYFLEIKKKIVTIKKKDRVFNQQKAVANKNTQYNFFSSKLPWALIPFYSIG